MPEPTRRGHDTRATLTLTRQDHELRDSLIEWVSVRDHGMRLVIITESAPEPGIRTCIRDQIGVLIICERIRYPVTQSLSRPEHWSGAHQRRARVVSPSQMSASSALQACR